MNIPMYIEKLQTEIQDRDLLILTLTQKIEQLEAQIKCKPQSKRQKAVDDGKV